ncbi:MAG: hypothetical protein AAGD05_13555, partial [Bacteroidota bacterium]
MEIIILLYTMIGGILLFFLIFPFITVLLSGLRPEKLKSVQPGDPNYRAVDYGCIITAYKDAEIAIPLVKSLVE